MKEKSKKNEKYQIISLGKNCFPRVVLTEYNLVKTKRQGRMSMPFDLAGHSIESVIKHLDTDFKFYFDGLKINAKTKEIENELTGSAYPHDKDCLDIDKLKNRYDNRIKNFRNAINDDTFTFFVIWDEYSNEEQIINLYKTLCKIRKENTFKLIVWNYGEIIDTTNDNISIINKQLPQKDWKWAEEEVKKEKSSIDYKVEIINFTKNEIRKNNFEVELYKQKKSELIIKSLKNFVKYIFSVNNDNEKKIKYMYLCGIKFKLKDLNIL